MNKLNKILCGALSATILTVSSIVPVMATEDITVILDGQTLYFDVPPQVINDRTMVPLRTIFEALGASVDWDQESRTVTSAKDGITVKLTIDSDTMYVNGNAVTLDSPACVVDNRTLVPVRAISEAYEAGVEWNGDSRTVSITSNGNSVPTVISYDNILANVNQINEFISSGMYIEAMQECENTKNNYNLSEADINIINDLYSTAQSKYNEYLQYERQNKLSNVVQSAVTAYVSNLKVPSSAQIYSIYAGYYERSTYNEDVSGSAIGIVIDGSGQNSFGGTTRSDTTIIVDEASGNMIVDLEGYGESLAEQSWGANYIKALNLQNEALYLQLHKTEIFQSFDVSTYFK